MDPDETPKDLVCDFDFIDSSPDVDNAQETETIPSTNLLVYSDLDPRYSLRTTMKNRVSHLINRSSYCTTEGFSASKPVGTSISTWCFPDAVVSTAQCSFLCLLRKNTPKAVLEKHWLYPMLKTKETFIYQESIYEDDSLQNIVGDLPCTVPVIVMFVMPRGIVQRGNSIYVEGIMYTCNGRMRGVHKMLIGSNSILNMSKQGLIFIVVYASVVEHVIYPPKNNSSHLIFQNKHTAPWIFQRHMKGRPIDVDANITSKSKSGICVGFGSYKQTEDIGQIASNFLLLPNKKNKQDIDNLICSMLVRLDIDPKTYCDGEKLFPDLLSSDPSGLDVTTRFPVYSLQGTDSVSMHNASMIEEMNEEAKEKFDITGLVKAMDTKRSFVDVAPDFWNRPGNNKKPRIVDPPNYHEECSWNNTAMDFYNGAFDQDVMLLFKGKAP